MYVHNYVHVYDQQSIKCIQTVRYKCIATVIISIVIATYLYVMVTQLVTILSYD